MVDSVCRRWRAYGPAALNTHMGKCCLFATPDLRTAEEPRRPLLMFKGGAPNDALGLLGRPRRLAGRGRGVRRLDLRDGPFAAGGAARGPVQGGLQAGAGDQEGLAHRS